MNRCSRSGVLSQTMGVADFRDENNFAYIQNPCRDVPWNVSTPKNHTLIQQRQTMITFAQKQKQLYF
ncbi:hypothetical protein VB711_02315, partial [Cronbergia sp. UHCC 0137]|uniref:hypothetical protein n=1 Tax=Cronbergia sp. UHCC 0137 TaxID=3110239 RepID=UPI002B1FCC7D